jgi:hypothetical protein
VRTNRAEKRIKEMTASAPKFDYNVAISAAIKNNDIVTLATLLAGWW